MSSIKTLVSLQTFIFDKMIKVKLNFSSESRRVYFLYYISISSPQASSISNSRSITGVGMRKLGDIWQYTIGESVRILLAEQSYLTERKSLWLYDFYYCHVHTVGWKQCKYYCWQDLSECQPYLAVEEKYNSRCKFLLPVLHPLFWVYYCKIIQKWPLTRLCVV